MGKVLKAVSGSGPAGDVRIEFAAQTECWATFDMLALSASFDPLSAGPIFSYTGRAADEVLDRGQYISAVLGQR